MKKMLLLLTVVAAFTFTAVAQYDKPSSSGQTADQKTTETSKKSAGSSHQMGAMSDSKGAKPKKESTLTGCISAQPDAKGMYTLSNGKYKKGVEIGPTDKVKDHAGHQVQLTGSWSSAGGEMAGASAEKKAKTFEIASMKHISDTCAKASGGGTTGLTKKGKKDTEKGKETAAPPKP